MAFETIIGDQILVAKDWLDRDELVGIPTETVYGLAGNGLNVKSVSKIFEAKNRPYFDPLILHFKDINAIKTCVREFPSSAYKLASLFWPGPLTLILPKSEIVPDLVTAGSDGVAVRVPQHPIALKLLEKLSYPLAAPSANPFKYVSPTCSQHVYDQLQTKIPYILEGGPSKVGIESTIVSFLDEAPKILRLGGIPTEEIQKYIPEVIVDIQHAPNSSAIPGQLAHHYAPKCQLIPLDSFKGEKFPKDTPLLLFHKSKTRIADFEYYLSENGNLKEATSSLFSTMREFDKAGFTKVYFEWMPDEGLGKAINDRLSRASTKEN